MLSDGEGALLSLETVGTSKVKVEGAAEAMGDQPLKVAAIFLTSGIGHSSRRSDR